MVRQESAKLSFPSSNLGGTSKQKSTARAVLFCLERCLPLRASDVAFGSDVHCVSDVSPYGEVGKHLITLRRRSNTLLWRSHNITSAQPIHHSFVFERCLPLRASDVAFGSDVHCVSDVSPCGKVGKHHITLRRRSNTSLWQSHNITSAKPIHHSLQTP